MAKKKKLLIVDDEAFFRELLKGLLSEKYDLRIHRPSSMFLQELIDANKIPFHSLYKWLSGFSAFKWLFWTQLILVFITFVSFLTSAHIFLKPILYHFFM